MKNNTIPALTLAFMLCLTGLVMSGEALAQRFVDNGNGTVNDTRTGLMWTQNANLFGKMNWHDAMSRCESFSISGIGGWRLPNMEELAHLSNLIQRDHPFTEVQSTFYWSSTTIVGFTDYAWDVNMVNRYEVRRHKDHANHVWPVRAGQ